MFSQITTPAIRESMIARRSAALQAETIGRQYAGKYPHASDLERAAVARAWFPSGLERDAFLAGFNLAKWFH